MTVAQFLDWDDGTDTRYELIAGVPVAMPPPHSIHGARVAGLVGEIRPRLQLPFRLFTGSGVLVAHTDDAFYVPDAVISCAPEGGAYIQEPIVAIEILSPSTSAHDRGTQGIGLPDDPLHARDRAAVVEHGPGGDLAARACVLDDRRRDRARGVAAAGLDWSRASLVGDLRGHRLATQAAAAERA